MSAAAPSILLADDDEVGRYVIATMLRRAGFTVRRGRRRAGRGGDACSRRRPTSRCSTSRCRGSTGSRRAGGSSPHEDDAAHPGADAVGDVHGDRGAGRRARDRRRRVPDAAGRGARAGGDDPLAAARAQPRGRGPGRGHRVAHHVRRDQRRRRRAGRRRRRRAREPGVPGRASATTSSARGWRRSTWAARAASCSSASGRTACAWTLVPGSQRLVVTLSDVTAARQTERERAAALARERTISRTLQQTLLPERLPVGRAARPARVASRRRAGADRRRRLVRRDRDRATGSGS